MPTAIRTTTGLDRVTNRFTVALNPRTIPTIDRTLNTQAV